MFPSWKVSVEPEVVTGFVGMCELKLERWIVFTLISCWRLLRIFELCFGVGLDPHLAWICSELISCSSLDPFFFCFRFDWDFCPMFWTILIRFHFFNVLNFRYICLWRSFLSWFDWDFCLRFWAILSFFIRSQFL
jgi:hypothetical protein